MTDMIIKDAIYGFVHVPPLCKAFIDTPQFERLRRIRQLGLAYFVFPSANHTRFEHCLGVMHLSGKVADKLKTYVSPREKELIQLAGLLHDVGHVAFSHLMDYILEEKNVNKDISNHEYRSVLILNEINNDKKLLSPLEVAMVSKMIHGDITGESKPFLFEIVNNKAFGVDVDRLDYLQRDMYHTGSPCFQPDYILECMTVVDNRLAVRKKALPEIEMMYVCRKRLLTLICRHTTVMKVEKLIRTVITKLDITGKWFEKNWQRLDDYRVHVMMEDCCPDIVEKIYRRVFPDIDENERYKHLKGITEKEIQERLKRVILE